MNILEGRQRAAVSAACASGRKRGTTTETAIKRERVRCQQRGFDPDLRPRL
jgi:hypothetical protein